ncbi:unnamed protein product [Amoebophrya sp. A25]|nr:unnamed protein product [Amoebophrya sp. A25]|eukprot:GSA25T00025071001.1
MFFASRTAGPYQQAPTSSSTTALGPLGLGLGGGGSLAGASSSSSSVSKAVAAEIESYQMEIRRWRKHCESIDSELAEAKKTHKNRSEQEHQLLLDTRIRAEAAEQQALELRQQLEKLRDGSKIAKQQQQARVQLMRQIALTDELKRETARLRQQLAERQDEIAAFDAQSAKLEIRVSEAMKAVREAFNAFQDEEKKSESLAKQLQSVKDRGMEEKALWAKERTALLKKVEAGNAREVKGDLVNILQKQVQSLQSRLLLAVGREGAGDGDGEVQQKRSTSRRRSSRTLTS